MKAQFLHFHHPYLFLHIALWHMSSPIMLFFHSLSFSHLFTEFIAIVFLHIIHFLNLFRRKKFPELIIILLTNIQYLSTLRERALIACSTSASVGSGLGSVYLQPFYLQYFDRLPYDE